MTTVNISNDNSHGPSEPDVSPIRRSRLRLVLAGAALVGALASVGFGAYAAGAAASHSGGPGHHETVDNPARPAATAPLLGEPIDNWPWTTSQEPNQGS